jgi:hypothetical protein
MVQISLIILSFPFIAGSFATFVVQEREIKAKHLVSCINTSAALPHCYSSTDLFLLL